MKQIQLETVDDAISVFNNWHQDVLMIIDDNIDFNEGDPIAISIISSLRDLVSDSPFKSEHFINTDTMYLNAEIIESIIND